MARSNYDQVSIRKPEGGAETLSVEEFQAIPLDKRVELIFEGRVQFFRNGKEIPVSEALRRPRDAGGGTSLGFPSVKA